MFTALNASLKNIYIMVNKKNKLPTIITILNKLYLEPFLSLLYNDQVHIYVYTVSYHSVKIPLYFNKLPVPVILFV